MNGLQQYEKYTVRDDAYVTSCREDMYIVSWEIQSTKMRNCISNFLYVFAPRSQSNVILI
jgi:hypothetical protein